MNSTVRELDLFSNDALDIAAQFKEEYPDTWKLLYKNGSMPDVIRFVDRLIQRKQLDEILAIRRVGDMEARKPGSGYYELCTAYDNHILKRAADLTSPLTKNLKDETDVY